MWHEPIHCPCCSRPVRGGDLPAELLAMGLGFSPAQGAILKTVMSGHGRPVQTETILRAIYHDDDSPPDPARQYATFKEKLCLMRPKLAGAGLAIENGGRGESYRLVRLAKQQDRVT